MNQQLQAELDALAGRLGRSISFDDLSGHLLGYSAQRDDIDQVRIAAILSRTVPEDVREWQRSHGIDDALGPSRLPANAALGMSARICVPVRDGHERLGHLWIVESSVALSEVELKDVSATAKTVAEILRSADARADTPSSRLADRLLGELRSSAASATRACRRLRECLATRHDAGYIVATVLRTPKARDASGASAPADLSGHAAAIRAALRRAHTVPAIDVTATAVVLLLPGDAARELTAELSRSLQRWTPTDHVCVVGLSAPTLLQPSALSQAFYQSAAAADTAAIDPASSPELTWPNLACYQYLLPEDRRPDPTLRLRPLTAADGSATMLITTLETYLDNAGDVQRTAAQLHLHRTTLYYRLKRITELLDVDLNDGATRTDLHLAVKQLRVNRRAHAGYAQTYG